MRKRPLLDFQTRKDVQVFRTKHITSKYYLDLYRSVGEDIGWVDRLLIATEELDEILGNEEVELLIFYKSGVPLGFAELDLRIPGEVKLQYFGLQPTYRGQGFGTYFLNWVIRYVWGKRPTPERFWLHTCELDHDGALPTYLNAGFHIYDEQIVDQVVWEEEI
ncbi:MAG: GNAT family N-acetyltransferase [Bacteroidota bacterium]